MQRASETPSSYLRTKSARQVKKALEAQGFRVKWDGDPNRPIHVEHLDWKRRYVH